MQAIDFNFIVLPLGLLVVILTVVILYIARRADIKKRQIERSIEKIKKEKTKKQEVFRTEQSELERLRDGNVIDLDTYERLSLLIKMNEKKFDETMDSLIAMEDLKKSVKKKKPEPPTVEPSGSMESVEELAVDQFDLIENIEAPDEDTMARGGVISWEAKKPQVKSVFSGKASKKKRILSVVEQLFSIEDGKTIKTNAKSLALKKKKKSVKSKKLPLRKVHHKKKKVKRARVKPSALNKKPKKAKTTKSTKKSQLDETLAELQHLESMQQELEKLFGKRFGELNTKIEDLKTKIDVKPEFILINDENKQVPVKKSKIR